MADDFDFLVGLKINVLDENTLSRYVMDLETRYAAKLNGPEFISEVISAK